LKSHVRANAFASGNSAAIINQLNRCFLGSGPRFPYFSLEAHSNFIYGGGGGGGDE
jgi:hypothetical protein